MNQFKMVVFVLFTSGLFHSCSLNISQKVRGFVSFFYSNYEFSRADELKLKDIHLDGIGLLNREVVVHGVIDVVGYMGAFIIIEEDQVRMLIDTSRVAGIWESNQISKGKSVSVLGVVQSSEKGHVFLTAKYIKAG